VGASGARILVGRGAAHNDALTLHVARPHDLWLHAKDRSGAHVVVALKKGESCPPELLVEAAHLAAHFSDARDERIVDVQYTPRRHLRKPRGSAPGLVLVDREKVLILRKDDEVLRRLLESEQVHD
jgi:predicted ribosome quality control (RQC) complex YloA/Tae2 family protein